MKIDPYKISSSKIISYLEKGENITITNDYGSMIIDSDNLEYRLKSKFIIIVYKFHYDNGHLRLKSCTINDKDN